MLCISVAPESRRLGKVDLYNASHRCDVIEFRLDRLGKEPDLKEMMEGIGKPILVSCRRKEDGGAWHGTEEERLLQLRTAIIAGPSYIELELDIADKVPRFGNTKRVVSITDLQKPLTDLEPLINEAIAKKADVIKICCPTLTIDAAWPLLLAVTKKRNIPVVGMGLGRPGVMFSLLAHKYGAPWTYAALEQGMETHPGQVTVSELEDTYFWRDVEPHTRFIGITGFGPSETAIVKAFNAGFKHLQINIRCLPLGIGLSDKISHMLDTLHVNVLLANPQMCERSLNLAGSIEEAARKAQYADMLVKQADGWHAFNTIWKSVIRVLERALGHKVPGDRPLEGRNVFIIGGGGLARSIALGAQQRKGILSITAADDVEGRQIAQLTGARFIPIANIYGTLCDIVLIAEAQSFAMQTGHAAGAGVKLNPAFLREHMYVADLTQFTGDSELLAEARARGCKIIEPAEIFSEYGGRTFNRITGKELPEELLKSALPAVE